MTTRSIERDIERDIERPPSGGLSSLRSDRVETLATVTETGVHGRDDQRPDHGRGRSDPANLILAGAISLLGLPTFMFGEQGEN